MPLRDILLGLLTAFIWGATFPVTAAALAETPPIFFACLRFAAVAIFIPFVPRPAVSWPVLILTGMLLGAGQYGFLFIAMNNGVPAGLASLLVHTQAIFTVAIAYVVFSEKLRLRQILAIGLAAAGLALLVINRSEASPLTGLVLILAGAICGGVGNNILKWLGGADMLGVAVWMSMAVPLPLFALSLIFEAGGSPGVLIQTVTWTTAWAVAYSAVLATVFAFAVWGRLFAAHQAVKVAPFFLLVPVFGMSLSAWLLGERLGDFQIAAAVLVFVGLCLAIWPARGT